MIEIEFVDSDCLWLGFFPGLSGGLVTGLAIRSGGLYRSTGPHRPPGDKTGPLAIKLFSGTVLFAITKHISSLLPLITKVTRPAGG